MDNRICDICGKQFDFPCHLERHKNGKKQCKKKLKKIRKNKKQNTNISITNNEPSNNITPALEVNNNLNNTSTITIASDITNNIINQNICNHCNSTFSTKYNLIRHTKVCRAISINNIPTNTISNLVNNIATEPSSDNQLNIISKFLDNINNFSTPDTIILSLFNYLQNTNNVENLNNSLSIIKDNKDNKDNKVKNIQNNDNSRTNTLNNTLNNILNQNNIQSQNNTINSNSNNNNNITTNNNIALPNIINPFGYEDISFITDDEKLQILKSSNGVELALEKIYSRPENRNFYKPNANKDNVSILNKDMKIQVKKQKQFNEQMINHGVLVMERMFYTCKNRLSFADQLLIWNNIEENRELLRFESNLTTILSVMETCFQDAISKEIFKKFSDKINREETFRLEKLKIVKELLIELERFNNDRNNITINDDFLRTEVWTKEEHKQHNVDGSEPCNDLALRHMENTPRYNFFEEMKANEFEYFDMHGASIGNIIEYRKILLQRAKAEIDRISDEYKNHSINENNSLANEIADKLINEPRLQMRMQLAKVKFINDNNLLRN